MFASILKSLRQNKNLTQQKLAEELNISKSSISMYENGKREPDFETMELIADYFNVDMNFLYGITTKYEDLDPRISTLNKREYNQYEKAISEATLFFEDETVSEEDKQKFLMAVTEAFFISKEINKKKYSKKKK